MIAKSATGDVDLGQPIPAAKVPEWLRVRGDEWQNGSVRGDAPEAAEGPEQGEEEVNEDRWAKPVAECRARGWFAICAGNGTGWRPCPEKTPGATEDLNRLSYFQQAGSDGYYQNMHFNEWIGSPIAAASIASLEDFAARGADALPTVRHYLPKYAAAVERAAADNEVRVEDVTARMLAGAEIAIWREENPPDVVTICQKCHVLPATMRCPEEPHERCHACWRIWFNGGVIQGRKRHPGRWSDGTRAKRARRLYKARMRRERVGR